MADISVTAASVVPDANAVIVYNGVAGATITAGQTLYIDAADSNKLKLADADAAGKTSPAGIALNGASAGQPVAYLTEGLLTFNAVLTAGLLYVLSDTAGGIMPAADLEAGDTGVFLGIATSTTVLNVKIIAGGAVG